MSFQEKSNLAVLAAVILVFGGYFGLVLPAVAAKGMTPPAVAAGGVLAAMTVLLIVLLIAAHIVIAVFAPKEAGTGDERDRIIEMRADARASYVLAAGVFGAMAMLWLDVAPFWVANALLGALVASEIVKGVLRAIAYRRGV